MEHKEQGKGLILTVSTAEVLALSLRVDTGDAVVLHGRRERVTATSPCTH